MSGKALWEQSTVPVPELKQERYQRLHRMMDDGALDALVVLAPAALGRKGSLKFLTNYSPTSRYGAVLFPRSGEPVLFVPYAVHIAWAEAISWVEEVRLSGDFPGDIAALLRARGLEGGRVGLAGEETMEGFGAALRAAAPGATFVPATPLLARLRLARTPLEIRLARQAAAMADRVFVEAAPLVAAGASEAEILAAGEATLRRMHAEESLLLIDSAGGQVMPLPSGRRVHPGDLVQYSVEPVSPGGHWIQSIRMFSRGAPSRRAREVVDTFIEALAAAEEALRPGVVLGEVAARVAGVLSRLAPQGRIPYGHGIGMDNFEEPLLHVGSEVIAEENMIIVIHPALIVEGQSYFLGDTYRVGASGAERLSHFPLELVVV